MVHIDSNDEQEERAVIWADSREILDKIIEIRKFQEGVQLKVMADGGQGFLKMCITVIPKNDVTSPLPPKKMKYQKKDLINMYKSLMFL